jgi:hypothetical protein
MYFPGAMGWEEKKNSGERCIRLSFLSIERGEKNPALTSFIEEKGLRKKKSLLVCMVEIIGG